MLFHCQLQEGMHHDLMKGPAVSGTEFYKVLCRTTKNKERRLAELRKSMQYRRLTNHNCQHAMGARSDSKLRVSLSWRRMPPQQLTKSTVTNKECFNCPELPPCSCRTVEWIGRRAKDNRFQISPNDGQLPPRKYMLLRGP